VDLKCVFDLVDRSALWLALRGIGTPQVLMGLSQDLHANTGARVRVRSSISNRSSTSSGVRQGCVLAPVLFNRAIDWIMEHADGLKGIKVGDLAFNDLDYADDIVLPVSLPTDLPTALAGFSDYGPRCIVDKNQDPITGYRPIPIQYRGSRAKCGSGDILHLSGPCDK